MFASPAQAVRAAPSCCRPAPRRRPRIQSLPLTVGIGIDLGDAVPVEGGFRGKALNTAARLCSSATAGEMLLTTAVAEAVARFEAIRSRSTEPSSSRASTRRSRSCAWSLPVRSVAAPERAGTGGGRPLARRRARHVHSARRPARRVAVASRDLATGATREGTPLLFVSGPPGIGNTCSWPRSRPSSMAARVLRYAGAGGAGAALTLQALREARVAAMPSLPSWTTSRRSEKRSGCTLLGESVARSRFAPYHRRGDVPRGRRASGPRLARRADERAGRRPPVPAAARRGRVEDVARLYAGADVVDSPLESVLRASRGVPVRVHEIISHWARGRGGPPTAAAAEYLAAGRIKRSARPRVRQQRDRR